jgi:hypothetical protein
VKQFIRVLSAAVRRAPLTVLIGAIVLTLAFGAFTPQQEQASGNEGFSPDSPEFLASQTIDEEFTSSSQVAVQVLFTARSGDLITAEGLRAYLDVREAVLGSRAAEVMGAGAGQDPGSSIVGFFDPVVGALQQQGVDPDAAGDAEVKAALPAALESLPPEAAERIRNLFSDRADLDEPSSPSALMVVFLALSELEDDPDQVELQAIQVDMAEGIREAAASSDEIDAEPFSFALLFANQDEFQSEIGRLFAAAGFIIITILASVFLIVPRRRSGVWLAGAGFSVLAVVTFLMVIEVLPVYAPLLAVVAVFAAWAFRDRGLRRSAADTLVALVVILMSVTWMNGIGVLLGPKYLGLIGKFSEILQIIPILLIGLGVDYAIHLTARYREEMGSGADVVTAATRASRTVGVALVLATVTTAVGFLTNVFSPVTAIADFGILATVGIGSAFILMLTFVPALRILLDRRAERRGVRPIDDEHEPGERFLPKAMGSLSLFAERVPALMLTAALALGGLGAWGLSNLSTQFSFTDFVPQGSPLLATFDTIADEFSGGFGERTQVLIEGDVADPDVHNGLVAAHANMADTPLVVTFDGRAQAESPVTVIAGLTTPPDEGGDPALYDAGFAAAAAAAGLQPDLTVGNGADVVALYEAAEAAAPDAMQRVLASGDAGSYRYIDVSVATQAGEQGAAELADDLVEDFSPVSEVEGVTAIPTNENIISTGVVEALQSSQASSLVLTLAAAMALLVLNFLIESRRPFLGVITIVPVALVVLWVFGAMAVTGISFNPVTAMIAAIAIGIGVPYTIHITHRYQEDRIRCDSPEDAIRSTMTHTGGALAGSAFTTVAGFGILVTSTLKPFQQFGLVVGYAIGFALVAAVLVLPSMLVLWDRWHRRRGDAVIDERALESSRVADSVS